MTKEEKVFGMYTDLPWANDGQWGYGKGKSFVFKYDD